MNCIVNAAPFESTPEQVALIWVVLPAACLWGASFPLALAAAAPQHKDGGRTAGAVYAANTVGAIVGAIAFSIIVIPALGTLWAQRILIAAAALPSSLRNRCA